MNVIRYRFLSEIKRGGDGAPPSKRMRHPARAAFSLLEVLLATTVLIIIILVISLVFGQMHNAWTSGTRRADSDTILRSIMGFVERDLTHAVDGSHFGVAVSNQCEFGDTGFACVTLDGTNRTPLFVDYVYDSGNATLTRTTKRIYVPANSTNWQIDSSPTPLSSGVLNGNYHLSQPLPSSPTNFSYTYPPGVASPALPLRVDVQITLTTNNAFSIVSGRSYGPDGKTGAASSPAAKDDIVVGE